MNQTDAVAFQKISFSQWEQAVSKLLKEPKKLQDLEYSIADQISMKPLYVAESLTEELAYLADFHAQWLKVFPQKKPQFFVHGYGFENLTESERAEAESYHLAGLMLEGATAIPQTKIPVFRRFGSDSSSNEFDPLGDAFRLGRLPAENWQALKAPKVVVHASDVHQAGGTSIQELAFGLLLAARYAETYGSKLEEITFQVAVGPAFWEDLAKMRTMRLLWMNLAKIHGINPAIATFRAQTSTLYWSRTDTDTNLIRHSAEVLSALLGGADQLLVHPHTFDPAQRLQAMRLGLNLGHLAQKEAHVDAYTDPAHGSFYLENLTHELAKAGWALFAQWAEFSPGALIQSEIIPKAAKANFQQLKRDFEAKTLVQIGVNRFPNELSRSSSPFPVFVGPAKPTFAALDPVFLDA